MATDNRRESKGKGFFDTYDDQSIAFHLRGQDFRQHFHPEIFEVTPPLLRLKDESDDDSESASISTSRPPLFSISTTDLTKFTGDFLVIPFMFKGQNA